MASKTVALDAEAYELLRRQKKGDESFSDAVKRLARPHKPLTSFAGMWKDLSRKERRDLDRVYSELHEADRRHTQAIRTKWGGK